MADWKDYLNDAAGSIVDNLQNNASQAAANIETQRVENAVAAEEYAHRRAMEQKAAAGRIAVIVCVFLFALAAVGGAIYVVTRKSS